MRKFTEPTARNLLRRPMVFGVPLFALIFLATTVLSVFILFGTQKYGNAASIVIAVIGYAGLRLCTRFAKPGWEESLIWQLERLTGPKAEDASISFTSSLIELSPPDTLDESALIASKEAFKERLSRLKPGERLTLSCQIGAAGAILEEVKTQGRFALNQKFDLARLTEGRIGNDDTVYSLYQLPVTTDPVWLFSLLSKIESEATALLGIRGVEPAEIKRRIEVSRRNNARGNTAISDIDADVTFEESSTVLKELSRGDESVLEVSLVIVSKAALSLDDTLFCVERDKALSLCAVLGIRNRLHRSHYVRNVTACDLIPNIVDPIESGASILRTLRNKPLYFSPNDSRLEALHWLVVGASGSGKSFFTGLVLNRMIQAGTPMSVIFVDHNRSFRRLVRRFGRAYFEPQNIQDLIKATAMTFDHLDQAGGIVGIELSDLSQDEKKLGAQEVLSKIETFLRFRNSSHPVYVVLDECWNFMRDEPVLVQRAFREFRKLNGAAIAITQSLSDFLTDQSGQSIFQNAPIRILLRQGEDLGRYQGILNLNEVELSRVRSLRQQKGLFSECLIKTPFLSRFGRLYPSEDEHALLRTDNLREEIIQEARTLLRERSRRWEASL